MHLGHDHHGHHSHASAWSSSRARGAASATPGDAEAFALRDRAVRRVLYITFALNLIVAAVKIAYGYQADVLSIRADGFHSLTDAASNIVALVGVWLAARPPDDDHPYGHAKLELFAAVAIGFSLLVMAFEVVRDAALRLTGAETPPDDLSALALVVLGATLAVNVGVALYERREARRLKSPVLESDAHHTLSDVGVTLCVIVAIVLVRAGYPILDALAAILVALLIGTAGVRVLWSNGRLLADAALIEASELTRIANAVPGVGAAHKVRSRGTPHAIFVDMHIRVAPSMSLAEAHELTHRVIAAIQQEHPSVHDVTIHTEPGEPEEPRPDEAS